MQPPARCSNHRCIYIDQCDDRSIQSNSDICDEVTYSNSQTEAKISHILYKVNILEGYQNQLENKLSQTDEN